MIPTFIMFNFGSEEMRKTPQISSQGLQSGEVLGISDQKVVLDYFKPFQNISSLYTYFLLFITGIGIISFTRFKLAKG